MVYPMENFQLALQQSAALQAEIDSLWDSFEPPSSRRGTVAAAYCSIVRQHVLAQQQLLALDFDVTAMTLVRPSFESLVRAIWIVQGASDNWIEQFVTPPPAEADARDETILGPPMDSMLATIQMHHPVWVHQALAELKSATWKPMHSYVHGGIRPVLQIFSGATDYQNIAVVRNGNGFLMFATNVLQMVCGAPAGKIAELQRRFSRCLPPQSVPGPQ